MWPTEGYACPSCGYRIDGIWEIGPKVSERYYTKLRKKIESEKMKLLVRFFEKHPHGFAACQHTLSVCKRCGEYKNIDFIWMFLPDSPEYTNESLEQYMKKRGYKYTVGFRLFCPDHYHLY